MTTAAEVKKIAGSLVARNADLSMRGRMIFLKPVRHFVRGILLGGSSCKHQFRPIWGVISLCFPTDRFYFDYKVHIQPNGYSIWDIRNPNTSDEFTDIVEKSVLPYLKKVECFEQSYEFYMSEKIRPSQYYNHHIYKIYNDIADEYFDEAEKICEILKEPDSDWPMPPHLQAQYDRVTNILCPLIKARNRKGIATLLHEGEAYSVKMLKLEKYWETSKFPIEMEDHEL